MSELIETSQSSVALKKIPDFMPSSAQSAGIELLKDWYHNKRHQQQIFRIFGFAGTGKTTVLTHALKSLGLEFCAFEKTKKSYDEYGEDNGVGISRSKKENVVVAAAYTGKASRVMTRKGTPACTIHSLIYKVSQLSVESVENYKKQHAELLEIIKNLGWGVERDLATAKAANIQAILDNAHKPQFMLNGPEALEHVSLIVIDEVSMCSEKMAEDLLSFGKPILVLGDPGQLPPIHGEGYFINAQPDVMLTQVHRQAGDSAVLELATMARQGNHIPFGQHDDHVFKMRRQDVTPAQMLKAGQVICGKNATRLGLNNAMRQSLGYESILPLGAQEKIMCLQNNNALGIVNGEFLTLEDVKAGDELSFTAIVKNEDGIIIGGLDKNNKPRHLQIYAGHFYDHVAFDKEREKRDWRKKRNMVEVTFGYAITCHKSQGSQWENIVVIEEPLGRTDEDRRRWLYTAITRAEKGLLILA